MSQVNRAKQLAARRRAREITAKSSTRTLSRAVPWQVIPQDLQNLDAVKDLLTALNDAYVGTADLDALVDEIPVLRARCFRRAADNGGPASTLGEALARIGNMGLEAELLSLLEDLTILRTELDASENR